MQGPAPRLPPGARIFKGVRGSSRVTFLGLCRPDAAPRTAPQCERVWFPPPAVQGARGVQTHKGGLVAPTPGAAAAGPRRRAHRPFSSFRPLPSAPGLARRRCRPSRGRFPCGVSPRMARVPETDPRTASVRLEAPRGTEPSARAGLLPLRDAERSESQNTQPPCEPRSRARPELPGGRVRAAPRTEPAQFSVRNRPRKPGLALCSG